MAGHGSEEHEIHLPAPSFAPAVISLGVMLIAFGLLWSVVLIALGGLLFLIGLVTWLVEDARVFVSRGEPTEGSGHGGH
jgi:hypothetical protein